MLRDLADLLKEGYVDGPGADNPPTGDGQIIDIAVTGLTEKGRRALGQAPTDEEAFLSQILSFLDERLPKLAQDDPPQAARIERFVAAVRFGGLSALRAALTGAAAGAGGVLVTDLIHVLAR